MTETSNVVLSALKFFGPMRRSEIPMRLLKLDIHIDQDDIDAALKVLLDEDAVYFRHGKYFVTDGALI